MTSKSCNSLETKTWHECLFQGWAGKAMAGWFPTNSNGARANLRQTWLLWIKGCTAPLKAYPVGTQAGESTGTIIAATWDACASSELQQLCVRWPCAVQGSSCCAGRSHPCWPRPWSRASQFRSGSAGSRRSVSSCSRPEHLTRSICEVDSYHWPPPKEILGAAARICLHR